MSTAAGKARPPGNQILAALPPNERSRLAAASETVLLTAGDVLYQPGGVIPYVHFPVECVIAVTVPLAGGAVAEAGVVGRSGLVSLSTFLGCDTTPFRAVVQNAGRAVRVRAADFRAALARGPTLAAAVGRYADAYLWQVACWAACNGRHTVRQRLCRWLLMTSDRTQSDHLTLTQEFLARMLGVQRTSVTEAAHGLQARGLLRYSRGRVTVLDRAGLEAAACECYAAVRAKYDALPDRPG